MSKTKNFSVLIVFIAFFSSLLGFKTIAYSETESPYYLIGPNDILNIFVWREPDLTMDVTVMSDGRITFPLIGNIMAQGQTVTAIKETITKKLKNYIDAPEVTVILRQSLSRRAYVIGNINSPGIYTLEANMTVLQILAAAGGFSDWADKKDILIIRRENNKETQIPFNYKEFVSGKNVGQNIVLKPNDTIVVP